ncbi:universal stress protein [Actinoplanes sp. KI2]|uniref:universal stress protein n=1 Tax=Actinoplanes sp. KI2 TaxID=2983315 RepID=UPI0021D5C71D|nr:universal stress protein [Actinoplanes sp. KI2]MCU7729416.1 universal stress protein [Actinoplanes sp. KI2]
MSDLDRLRTERDSRQARAARVDTTRYSGAVNRYLGVLGYRPDDWGAPGPGRVPPGVVAKTGLVLVGVDDSPISYTAVDHAAIEAELRGWDLRLVHVQGSRPSAQDAGARLLDQLAERVRACAPSVAVTSRIVTGAAASRLLVEGRHAGLVVVGHRHGAASSVFGVSVGERVAVDHNGVVMVVRIPGWPPGPGFAARPIVVGVDGDDSPAVGFAHAEARLRGSELVLLHAGRTPRVEKVELFGGVRMHRRFVADDPAAALIDASAEAAALVVGRHGPGGMPAGMLGSVSRAVVQHAHCPVFLVS